MSKFKIIIFSLLSLVFFSCQPEIENPEPQPGAANFIVYAAVGNSLTAGYADNELYRSGQENSFPALLAGQLKHVGLEEFNQPLMYDELGLGNRLYLRHRTDCLGHDVLIPLPAVGEPHPDNFAWLGNNIPFHNVGVPGAKTGDLLKKGYALENPYYFRFAVNQQTSSIIEDAMGLNPTFFTLWIGNNDFLPYAVNGAQTGSLTPTQDFSDDYKTALIQLTSFGARGAIATLPDISNLPFFSTIPYNGLTIKDIDQVIYLNQLYEDYSHITFSEGKNPFVVYDPSSPGGIRQLQEGELVLLSLSDDSLKCSGLGSTTPISAKYFLDSNKINQIKTIIQQYNEIIVQYSKQYNLALVDVHEIMENATSGFEYDGVNLNTEFITGGIFSLDGIHLSKRGNAMVANHFIEAINERYGSTIPKLNVSDYSGIVFP